MIKDADDNQLKDKFGRIGYVRATIRSTKMDPGQGDGRARRASHGSRARRPASLVGNVGTILGGVNAFADASPTDGRLDVGVVQAKSRSDWMRVAARGVTGRVDRSPFVEMATAKKIKIELKHKMPWEVDGGDKTPAKKFKIRCIPAAVRICQPAGDVMMFGPASPRSTGGGLERAAPLRWAPTRCATSCTSIRRSSRSAGSAGSSKGDRLRARRRARDDDRHSAVRETRLLRTRRVRPVRSPESREA